MKIENPIYLVVSYSYDEGSTVIKAFTLYSKAKDFMEACTDYQSTFPGYFSEDYDDKDKFEVWKTTNDLWVASHPARRNYNDHYTVQACSLVE